MLTEDVKQTLGGIRTSERQPGLKGRKKGAKTLGAGRERRAEQRDSEIHFNDFMERDKKREEKTKGKENHVKHRRTPGKTPESSSVREGGIESRRGGEVKQRKRYDEMNRGGNANNEPRKWKKGAKKTKWWRKEGKKEGSGERKEAGKGVTLRK